MKKKKLILIIGAVLVVVALVVANLTMTSGSATDVQADQAKRRDVTETVSASGRIQPQTKVDITSEINGEIVSLLVREGDRAEIGEMLVVLDTVQLRSDVDQARYSLDEITARLEGAKSTLAQAEEEYEIQSRLLESGGTAETVYKAAKYAYESSHASYKAMQAQSSQMQAMYSKQLDNLSKAKIVAPMPGIITFLDCEVGEIAAAQTSFTQGRTLMTIANLEVFEVEVEVDETEINKIELLQHVDIEVDAFPDTTFDGNVVEIGNTAITAGLGSAEQSTNFRVKVIFEDPAVKLRPGMSATVDVTTSLSEDALTIPYSAVVMRSLDLDSLERSRNEQPESSSVVGEAHAEEVGEDAEGDMADDADSLDEDETKREDIKGVFVIRDGEARFVQVETGIADTKRIEIVSGLEDGDSVISGPYRVLRNVKDGEAVEALDRGNEDEG